jgi:hypothetical protein
MSIYIFTNKAAALKTVFGKSAQFRSVSELSGHSPGSEESTYIDVSGLTDAEIKKVLPQIKKACRNSAWGVIDSKGSVKDIGALFFDGACDYLGPHALKDAKLITPKRLKEPVHFRKLRVSSSAEAGEEEESSGSVLPKTGIKLPESSFTTWKKVQSGKSMSFYLLYCAIQGKVALDTRFDMKVVAQVHGRFLEYLEERFEDCDGLLWINTGKDCLFLIPPKAKCVEEAVKACIGTIISAPLVTFETLGITVPVNFIFALHYGSVTYKPPGSTGTVVSDAVNHVFHLGAKKAETGRLTISGDLPDKTIPQSLHDSFISVGEFEERKIWHTKKFTYPRPWV